MVNFLFYSLNEAPGSYLSCVKISAQYLKDMAILLFNTLKLTYSMMCLVFQVE